MKGHGISSFVLLLFLILPFFAHAQEIKLVPLKKVLLIHSYHPDFAWTQGITQGVVKAFEGRDIKLNIHFMDTKRYTSTEWMATAGEKARLKISELNPDIVITADDAAQAFVARHFLNQGLNFVFCGVNADPAEYGFPADNITGVVERRFINESIEFLREMGVPVHTVGVMGNAGKTTVASLTDVRKNIRGVTVLDYKILETFPQWQKQALDFSSRADAIVFNGYNLLEDSGASKVMETEPVIAWTMANVKVPSIGLTDYSVKQGILCGVVESPYEQGLAAGHIALRIMDGEKALAIPVQSLAKGQRMINLKTARLLGITVPESVLTKTDIVIDAK